MSEADLLAVSRELDATWFIPTEDEWHKAAYHKNDGTTGNYFDFPMSSDDRPTADAPPGGPNSANIDEVVVDGSTDVGAYTFSVSPYGTFDQGGNVWEHTEALSDHPDVVDFFGEAARAARGGYWGWNFTSLAAAAYSEVPMTGEFREHYGVGFRVATVPEPGGFALAGIALMGLLTYRRRK